MGIELLLALACLSRPAVAAQPPYNRISPSAYADLKWRMIGPFRGGRTVGATGVPGQPNVFYIGVNDGGVWKSTDYGRVWRPIFDDQPTGSIGALAVATSDPNTVYVGSGEGLQRPDLSVGDGLYRSRDAGKTWVHLGLRDGLQIAAILVDPRDANRLFVSVLGHPYGPNPDRGIYRSTDGGETFAKVLYKGPDTGGMAMAFDPTNPDIVYADLFAARQGPWENGTWEGPGSGLFKSSDGGITWRRLESGLPGANEGLGRIGFAVAPSDGRRMYALVDAREGGGLYRSDDAGETWKFATEDRRIWGRGDDFAEVKVDPKNEDILYSANTSTYKSTDGGRSWAAWKGSPGGDDYHTVWINPDNPQIILLASDQGACITVNGGETWSSWYNQPTAQMYHVATDNRFPYWVYSGQQESGSAGVASRGPYGEITFREWHPVAAEEYAYIAPDPLHPGVVFGGKVSRYDEATGQSQDVSPQAARFGGSLRFLRTMPLLFSPVDPHTLYLASNVLLKTMDGGHSWSTISPDLSRPTAPPPPESVFKTPTARRGVIYAVGPSYRRASTIWAGTDDGLVWRTVDGGAHWTDVTPPSLTPWSKIAQIDAGRFDDETAYVAVNRMRLDDYHPYIYRTHDGGKTWELAVIGLPERGAVDVVREDPVRKGLLYAGTENAVYVSFDDGSHWESLRLNMPATSIRDLVVHEDDLVIGTHGRGFWILDDVTPLRQATVATPASATYLYAPETAVRVRWDMNSDTPLPPDEPAGTNPPDGAVLDYYLGRPADKVTLEILDPQGGVVRRYASDDPVPAFTPNSMDVPDYWLRPPQRVPTSPGHHRFLWDMRYGPVPEGRRSYTMAAVVHDTPPGAVGPWVMPGTYTVRLTANGVTTTAPIRVVMDPRVKATRADLQAQFDVAHGSYDLAMRLRGKGGDADRISGQLLGLMSRASGADAAPTEVTVQEYRRLRAAGEKLAGR